MLFNSVEFLAFFPVVTLGYFLLPHRHRWWWLLAASAGFYVVFRWVYLLILVFTIAVDYVAGRLIEHAHGKRRKAWLILSIAANLGVLAAFKYYPFITENLGGLAAALGVGNPLPVVAWALPIGLSFHTFQAMSYTIEVYRGRQPAERHFGLYALYVMFYPQLVAGPIERPQNVLPQLRAPHAFSYPRLISGLQLMAWGLIKKMVIADRLAVLVDQVYDHPSQYTGLPLLLATAAFAIQIYCDFSGYSDIALGAAETMGFSLMKNFDRPYFAQSVAEFWQRWHISLSTWLRDYLYIPLGGNRVGAGRHYINLGITFVLSGLWHGASWHFVVWGALHGAYLVAATATAAPRHRLAAALGLHAGRRRTAVLNILTTGALVSFAWIFFRAATLADAAYICRHLFTGLGQQLTDWRALPTLLTGLGLPKSQLAIGGAAVAALVAIEWLQHAGPLRPRLVLAPAWVRWPAYYGLVLSLLLLAYATSNPEFIYFQF